MTQHSKEKADATGASTSADQNILPRTPVTMASSARSSPSDDASVAAVELNSWNGAARVGKFMCVVPPKVRSMGPISLTSTRANDKT